MLGKSKAVIRFKLVSSITSLVLSVVIISVVIPILRSSSNTLVHNQIETFQLLQVESTSPEDLLGMSNGPGLSSPVSIHRHVWVPEDSVIDRSVLYAKVTRVLLQHQNSTPDPLVEHSRGVEVLSDGIKILHPGLYYIYSNLHFQAGNVTPCTDLTHKRTINCIQKTMEGDIQHGTTLAMAQHECPDTCVLDEETSYTATTTILQAGDVIRVVVSGYGVDHLQPLSSFVGLFMLATV